MCLFKSPIVISLSVLKDLSIAFFFSSLDPIWLKLLPKSAHGEMLSSDLKQSLKVHAIQSKYL